MARSISLFLTFLLLGAAFAVSPALAGDLDGDAIEDALDPNEAEFRVQQLSMRKRKDTVRIKVDGFMDLGVLGHGTELEGLDDLLVTIAGSDGSVLTTAISADGCRQKGRAGLSCRAGKARLSFKKVRGISDSASRYRVRGRVAATANDLPAEPYEVTVSVDDVDWWGMIAPVDCRGGSRKVSCRTHRGIEKVPTIMAPALVIHTPDGKLLERPLEKGTVTVGAAAENDVVILAKEGVDLSRLQVEAKEGETWVLDLLDSASGEARVMEAGEIIALGDSGEVTATLVYRPLVSQARSFVELDRNRRQKKSERSSRSAKSIAKPSKLIAFGDSITGAYTYYPGSTMLPDNYGAFGFCSPPTGWPNSQCSNNAPGVYTGTDLLEDHFHKKHAAWALAEAIYDQAEDPGLYDFLDKDAVSTRSQAESMTRKDKNPIIAYSYQMQQILRAAGDDTPVFNYGMSGATPAHWAPQCHGQNWYQQTNNEWKLAEGGCTWSGEKKGSTIGKGIYPSGGIFAKGCDLAGKGKPGVKVCGPFAYDKADESKIEDSATTTSRVAKWQPKWTVESEAVGSDVLWIGTLGANPLLRRWMRIHKGPDMFGHAFMAVNGDNIAHDAKTDIKGRPKCMSTLAAASKCMTADLAAYDHQSHIENSLSFLLERGNVVVMKYYHDCFGLFGDQSEMSGVPTDSGACTEDDAKIAYQLTDQVNQTVHKAVVAVRGSTNPFQANSHGYRIIEVCPGNVPMASDGACHGGYWEKHSAWKHRTSSTHNSTLNEHSWVNWNDSGMHPNPTGHAVLAQSAMSAICQKFGYWCDIEDGRFTTAHDGAVKWDHGSDSQVCTHSTECAFFSVQNKTETPLILKRSFYAHNDLDHGYQYIPNTTRNAGDGKFLMFPLWRVEPNRTMRAMAQNHDEFAGQAPTIQLEFEAGGGPIVFNVDSDFDGDGTVAAYSSSPLFKIESLGSADAHRHGIVGNWKVMKRPASESARHEEAIWEFAVGNESAHNKEWCEAAMQDGGSTYASYYSILNKGPETIYLKTDPKNGLGGLDHGVWCVKPASVVPPGYATMAVIGDDRTAAEGTKGNVTWTIGSPSGTEFWTAIRSQPSRQGYYGTSTADGLVKHTYTRSREAELCTLGTFGALEVLDPGHGACSNTDTTVANVTVWTGSGSNDGLLAVGAECGDALQGPQPGYACESMNAICGRTLTTKQRGYNFEYTALCKEPGGTIADNRACYCRCQHGMVEIDGECIYPDCPTACTSWGSDSPASDAAERSAVCYRNAPGDSNASCWAPFVLSDGTKACNPGISPADSLCRPVQ